MAKTRIVIVLAALMFTVPRSFTSPGQVQTTGGGDQFLDGIGETALVARYVFNGNAEDRSRNNLHAALRGDGTAFVQDPRFGQTVLQLSGKGGYVQLPGQALSGEDAMSVTRLAFPELRRARAEALRLRAGRGRRHRRLGDRRRPHLGVPGVRRFRRRRCR